ncbi:MAG: acetate kinase [Arcobacteraceae bacterium]
MLIFVLNAGSSSLKYQLIHAETAEVKASGIVERIGIDGILKHEAGAHRNITFERHMPTHKEAIDLILHTLTHEDTKVIDSIEEIKAIGHRVAHGGEHFDKSVIVNKDVMNKIKELIPLAPLHNPANILGMEICQNLMPTIPNIAVFDTAFHQTMDETHFLFPVPHEDYTEHHLRKYGFHGTSHYYVSNEAIKLLDNKKDTKIIVCHLGNGASICAVKDGKSVNTTMGLTPLGGLMMGTRSGDIDAGVIPYLMDRKKMNTHEIIDYLNKRSGILGVSGISSDLREIISAANNGEKRAKVTIEMMANRVKKYICSYAGLLSGPDAICFTAGIGENSALMRKKACKGLEFMGIEIDDKKNNAISTEAREIQSKNSKTKIFVIPTNEEFVIARDTYELTK